MEKVIRILAVIGILLIIYSVIGRFTGGGQQIGFGIITSYARSGLILGNSFMLIAIVLKLFFSK